MAEQSYFALKTYALTLMFRYESINITYNQPIHQCIVSHTTGQMLHWPLVRTHREDDCCHGCRPTLYRRLARNNATVQYTTAAGSVTMALFVFVVVLLMPAGRVEGFAGINFVQRDAVFYFKVYIYI